MRKKTVAILAIVLFVIAIIVKAGVSKDTNNVTHKSESNKQQTATEETDDDGNRVAMVHTCFMSKELYTGRA